MVEGIRWAGGGGAGSRPSNHRVGHPGPRCMKHELRNTFLVHRPGFRR